MPPVERTSKARFFFVVSMLLLASIAWSIWDEIEGRRPWKDYQREFNRLENEKVVAELDDWLKKTAKDLTSLDAEIQKTKERLAESDELAAAQSRLTQIQEELDRVSLENKFTRSEMDEAYFEFKHSLREGSPATVEKARYVRLETMAGKLGKSENDLLERETAARAEIEKLRKPLRDLEAKKEKLGANVSALQRRLEGIQRRVPTIYQIVIEGVKKNNFDEPVLTVDRCQTCHLAVNRAGFEDFPAPFKTHPKRDVLLAKHPPERFGCTLCHGGQGQALNSITKAHGINFKTGKHLEFWEEPLLRGSEMQANCLRCHSQTLDIPMAPVVSKGKRMFIKLGCHGCHLLQGYENLPKVGPSLLKISAKVRPEWMIPWIVNPREYLPKTQMPFFSLNQDEAAAITAYLLDASKDAPPSGSYKFDPGSDREKAVEQGKKLFETRGCLACHNIDGKGGEFGPDLSRVGTKVRSDWVVNWLKNPKHYDPGTVMPSLKLPDEEAQHIAAYLLTLGKPAPTDAKLAARLRDPAAIQEGRRLIENFGCYGCHDIKGMEKQGRLSVELTRFANKKPAELDFGDVTNIEEEWEAWVFAKLKNPRIFSTDRISLRMPNFYLTDEEARTLRTFLSRWNGDEMAKEFVRKLNPREAALERGRRIVEKYNCTGCHIIEGQGGFIRKYYKDMALAPPVLNGEGAKARPDWLFGFLKHPFPLRPQLNNGIWMPKFGLTDDETADLVRYFIAQEKNLDVENPYLFVDVNAVNKGNATVGKFIFQTFQCLECHSQKSVGTVAAADLAPDLAMAKDRLRPGWIMQWLRDPQKLQPGTKMPTFFSGEESPLESVWKGSATKQIEALKDYLLLFDGGEGEVGPIPKGIITEETDEDKQDKEEEEDEKEDEKKDDGKSS